MFELEDDEEEVKISDFRDRIFILYLDLKTHKSTNSK